MVEGVFKEVEGGLKVVDGGLKVFEGQGLQRRHHLRPPSRHLQCPWFEGEFEGGPKVDDCQSLRAPFERSSLSRATTYKTAAYLKYLRNHKPTKQKLI